MNIYSQIDNNKKETVLIMLGFIVVVSFLGWFIGEYFFEGSGLFMLGFALIFSGLSSFVSYYFSDQIVLSMSGAKEIKETDNPYVFKIVENLCIGAGLPMPKVYVIEDTAMNAFATGRDPEHSVVCFTTGIISRLDKLELEGVTAHELSHIKNYDIRLMSIVTVLVGTIVLLSDFFTRGALWGGGGRRRREGSGELTGFVLVLGILLLILGPVIATLIKLAVSRNREYLADASAALLTRYPKGLADALRKISSDTEVLEAANSATAHLYIDNPLKSTTNFLSGLFNTHPPAEDRIRRLLEM